MSEITTILWDVGGVVLTNGWDTHSRLLAAEKFGYDRDEFEGRHQALELAWDRGLITMEEYLDQAVFHSPRNFSRAEFKEFIFSCSQPHAETIAFVEAICRSGLYFLAAVNNEPLELNLRRIDRYGLRKCFCAFFSSCFLGVAKPDPEIYRRALLMLQRSPSECLFIDDRLGNLESAGRLGIRTLHYQDLPRLRRDLQVLGIRLPPNGAVP